MTQQIRSRFPGILCLLATIFLLNFSLIQDAKACSEPPEIPPGVEVTALDEFGQFFEIRLDGYSTFGSPDGTHFCACGLGFIFSFPFEVIDVLGARLVLHGTDMTFMTFDFENNGNTEDDIPGDDLGADLWFGLFAEVNGVIDPGIPVDLVFTIAVDLFGQEGAKRKLNENEIKYTEEEIRGSLAFVITDEANSDGTLTGNHPGIYDLRVSLPVELVDFSAAIDANSIQLDWSTASETNNSGFEIQHSSGGDFRTHGFVQGNGTTTETIHYEYRLNDLLPGAHRFRLKQIDYGGSYHYSPIIEAEIDVPGNYLILSPYPNPFTSVTTLSYSVKISQEVTVTLFDMLGQELQKVVRETAAGNMVQLDFNISDEPAGVYLIHIRGQNFEKSFPVTAVH